MKKRFILTAVLLMVTTIGLSALGCAKTDPQSGSLDEGIHAIFNLNYNGAPAEDQPEKKELKHGKPYGELPTPTRKGFVFDGWYPDKYLQGDEVTAETLVTWQDDHSLFAKWKGTKITLSYDLQGGKYRGETTMADRAVYTGNKYSMSVPSVLDNRYGYLFVGWYLTPECDGKKVESSTIIETPQDHTLYAGWKKPTTLYDFEDPRHIDDMSFGGEATIVDFEGSKQLRMKNTTGISGTRLYIEFGGEMPAGTVLEFDMTFKGSIPNTKYVAGVYAYTTMQSQLTGNETAVFGYNQWQDGASTHFRYNPQSKMTGIMLLMLYCQRNSSQWEGEVPANYWELEPRPEEIASNTFYMDNVKITFPAPNPVIRDRYDLSEADDEEIAANYEFVNLNQKLTEGRDGKQWLTVTNPSTADNVGRIYLKRPIEAGKKVKVGLNFAGTPAVSSSNRVQAYLYGMDANNLQLGSKAGDEYTIFSPNKEKEIEFTVGKACQKLCIELVFGDEWQSRAFSISYIEITDAA